MEGKQKFIQNDVLVPNVAAIECLLTLSIMSS
jgi:hypothetical protein